MLILATCVWALPRAPGAQKASERPTLRLNKAVEVLVRHSVVMAILKAGICAHVVSGPSQTHSASGCNRAH